MSSGAKYGSTNVPIPGATSRDVAFRGLPQNPDDLLNDTIYPDDAYKGNTYWADLPTGERTKWVNNQHNEEARRELTAIWQSFKVDPLRPFSQYFHNYAITGVGFFSEGYVLFSVGNILTLFESVWPQCFKHYEVCDKTMVQAIR